MENLTDKEKSEFFDKIYNEKYAGKNQHNEPSPETLRQLEQLKIKQGQDDVRLENMDKKIDGIVKIVEKIDEKFDTIMECKAEKSEVENLSKKYETLNNFMWKAIGISLVAVVVFGTLATLLIDHLMK